MKVVEGFQLDFNDDDVVIKKIIAFWSKLNEKLIFEKEFINHIN
jgi:hypothetical protein